MVAAALEGREGKQPDGSAKTREIKLGCVFTQTTWDEAGQPLRDYQTTSYVASFAPTDEFMVQLRQEAIRRRMAAARLLVLLGDGAAWIWEQGGLCFPLAIQILDLYHALEHLTALTRLLERNFHEFLSRESRFRPYFSRVLRTWLIFLRVPTVTWASGTVLGRLSFKAANNRC